MCHYIWQDSERLEVIGHDNGILTMVDSCSFRLMNTRKIMDVSQRRRNGV